MLIVGFIFAVIGGCVIWFLGSDITLNCQRSTDTCILEKSDMLGRKEVVASLALSRLKSAEVAATEGGRRSDGRRKRPTYQVVLHTADGNIPFSNAWTSNYDAHKRTAGEINTYLASSNEHLTLVQSGKFVRLIGWVFLASGGLAFLRGLRGTLAMFRSLASIRPACG